MIRLGPWFLNNRAWRRTCTVPDGSKLLIHISVWQSTLDGKMVITITDGRRESSEVFEAQWRIDPTSYEEAMAVADEKLTELKNPFVAPKLVAMI